MSTYQDLMNQINELKSQAEQARKAEISETLSNIKKTMSVYGITLADLGGRPTKAKRAVSDIVKYRDPATGLGWSGRGRRPGWVNNLEASGKTLEECRVV